MIVIVVVLIVLIVIVEHLPPPPQMERMEIANSPFSQNNSPVTVSK